ncbi:Spo0E family sporulation regulatory protein-aspartic acid phosphatase [Clostridium oryzae]|nr:Spo0E family sporulation regulatory protein-aspartic acid phosphatase [Clostridium oryzae]
MKRHNLDCLIENLRDILNDICVTIDDVENDNEKLIVSRCLDELIVEYMKQNRKEKMLN